MDDQESEEYLIIFFLAEDKQKCIQSQKLFLSNENLIRRTLCVSSSHEICDLSMIKFMSW